MKQCPRCRAVVRDDYECPFCHETLTYEDPVMEDKPHMPWNRYTVLFWLKVFWFPLLCLAVSTVRLLTLPETAPGFLEIGKDGPIAVILSCLLFSFVTAFLAHAPIRWPQRPYRSEEYQKFRCAIICYLCGCLAVLFSFVLFF